MPALVCGSLAFDSIANFGGRFADQILPNQLHVLNVSFLVPTLRREFGGCAGNIAYNLAALGGEPVVVAAVGADGSDYLARLRSWGTTTDHVRSVAEAYTAQAFIITDLDNNQITAFHPGAMQWAHETPVPARSDLGIAIVAPDGRTAMLDHARQLADAGVPFIFDPGQGLPMFDGEELRAFVDRASWVAVNDYEAQMLAERTGRSIEALSRSHLRGIVVTLGAQGCEIWQQGEKSSIPGVAATEIVDPTGCGDAFRAAMLFGLERGWPLADCARLGNRLGALKIASRGGQNHVLDRTFSRRVTGRLLKFSEVEPKSHLMDIRQAGVLIVAIPVALLVASVATWAVCRWWFGRKLLVAANRLQKSEKGRLFSQQQTAQARQQIGLLKAEIESHQQVAAENQAARRRAVQAEEALQASERAAEVSSQGAVMLPLVAAHGFADTQILPD